jgi:RNA-binding protein YhbY
MSPIDHTIIALGWSAIIAVVFYIKGKKSSVENIVESILTELKENNYIKTKIVDGEEELIKHPD